MLLLHSLYPLLLYDLPIWTLIFRQIKHAASCTWASMCAILCTLSKAWAMSHWIFFYFQPITFVQIFPHCSSLPCPPSLKSDSSEFSTCDNPLGRSQLQLTVELLYSQQKHKLLLIFIQWFTKLHITFSHAASPQMTHLKFWIHPWLVWLSGLRASLWIKRPLVWFPVRVHAWVVGLQEIDVSPSLSHSFHLSLKINK